MLVWLKMEGVAGIFLDINLQLYHICDKDIYTRLRMDHYMLVSLLLQCKLCILSAP
jgi:hypothetical protein